MEGESKYVFGGCLTRSYRPAPEAMAKLVTVTRLHPKSGADALFRQIRGAMGATNEGEAWDDEGVYHPPKSLVYIGAEGTDDGDAMVLAHLFLPIDAIHDPQTLEFVFAAYPAAVCAP